MVVNSGQMKRQTIKGISWNFHDSARGFGVSYICFPIVGLPKLVCALYGHTLCLKI